MTIVTQSGNGKKAANHTDVKFGQVYDISIKDIKIKWDWNTRTGNWKGGTSAENESGYDDLKHSMETVGQEQPVVIRPNTTGGKEPFELVSGFRRTAVALELKWDTVKAMVLQMTNLEARENNIRENTARADLKGPDLAFGLADLKKEYLASKKPWVQAAVAQTLGLNQGYVNMLDKIMTKLDESIAKQWHEAPVSVPIQAMAKLADVEPAKQPEAFEKLLKDQAGKADGRSKKGKEQLLVQSAERVGKLLGRLVYADYIQVTRLEADDREFWSIMGVSIPEDMEEVPADMIKAANKAYQEALTPKAPEPLAEPTAKKGSAKKAN